MPMSRMVIMAGGDIELKTSWPEVVGMGLFPAARKIYMERPDLVIEVHAVGVDPGPGPGFDPKRVRVFVNQDANYTVAKTPVVG